MHATVGTDWFRWCRSTWANVGQARKASWCNPTPSLYWGENKSFVLNGLPNVSELENGRSKTKSQVCDPRKELTEVQKSLAYSGNSRGLVGLCSFVRWFMHLSSFLLIPPSSTSTSPSYLDFHFSVIVLIQSNRISCPRWTYLKMFRLWCGRRGSKEKKDLSYVVTILTFYYGVH